MGFVWLDIAFEFRRWPLLLNPKPSHAMYYTDWLFINKSSKLDICCLELFSIIETCICYKHVTSFLMGGGGANICDIFMTSKKKSSRYGSFYRYCSQMMLVSLSLFDHGPWTNCLMFCLLRPLLIGSFIECFTQSIDFVFKSCVF